MSFAAALAAVAGTVAPSSSLSSSSSTDDGAGWATAHQRYLPTWDSLDSRPTPSWYEQARFGIKIHWGPYAVPGWGALGQYAEQYKRFYQVTSCPLPITLLRTQF